MISSVTLIRVVPVKDIDVFKAIKAFSEVKEIMMTYGEYDLVIKVESQSLEDLDNFIFNKLRTIDGVSGSTTLIEAKPRSKS